MEIAFDITTLPSSKSPLFLYCYLEGRLVIRIDRTLFFNEPEINLVEFACQIKQWMQAENWEYSSFEYTSIDHDETILTMHPTGDAGFTAESIWSVTPVTFRISAEMIRDAFDHFCNALDHELLRLYRTSLNEIIADRPGS